MTKGLDPVNILVVDDEEGIRQGSKRIIDRMGCRTLTADRGEAGLEILEKEDVGIVLLDLKMPGIDGMEVLRIIGDTISACDGDRHYRVSPPSRRPSKP